MTTTERMRTTLATLNNRLMRIGEQIEASTGWPAELLEKENVLLRRVERLEQALTAHTQTDRRA